VSEEAAITEQAATGAATPVHTAWTPEGEAAPPSSSAAPSPPGAVRVDEEKVIEMLKTVFDPEIPVDIYELGLIYAVEIADDGKVKVEMTLTTPGCPLHESITSAVEMAVNVLVPEVESVGVNLVWSPPWCPDRISAAGREELGWR